MKSISNSQQNLIKRNIEKNSHNITEILEKIVADKWIDLAPKQNTIKRLKRKGLRESAEQYIKFEESLPQIEILDGSIPTTEIKSAPAEIIKINKIVKEGIVGSDDMINSNFLHKGARVTRSVGRISNKISREPLGTGFLVSPNLLMTNNHVLPSINEANDCIVEFDYFSDNSGEPIQANEFEMKPNDFFLTSDQNEFDYTIITIEPKNRHNKDLKEFGWIKLIEDTGKAHIGERLNIIHHPLGKPQQISIRKNLLITHDESPVYLKYITDTMPGSSGSPVLNDQWELVALHRASEEINDENQKKIFFQAMYKIDKNMASEMKEGEVVINSGVRISTITNNINSRKSNLTLARQKLIDEMFLLEVPTINDSQININKPSRLIEGYDNHQQDEYNDNPINISINIGNRNYGESSDTRASSYVAPQNQLNVNNLNKQLEIYDKKLNSQKSVFKALTFLEKARSSEYLPVKAEIKNRINEYYGSIPQDVIGGLEGSNLYNKLNQLLESTLELADRFPEATKDLESLLGSSALESLTLEGGVSYARSRAHLYTWVDLQEDRMLRGVYTQALIAPEQLLLKDLIESLKLDIELPRRFNNNQFLNCEHIVPQSLFNKEKVGVSDLHHLITAEGATNTFRSNFPYRDLGSSGEAGPDSLVSYIKHGGKKHNKFFEPFNNKPLVARATLYFFVAHKNKIKKESYDIEAIKTLKEWSNSAKPNNYELHRNESIFEIQGNRNPFIDFPEWVDKVDFSQGILD